MTRATVGFLLFIVFGSFVFSILSGLAGWIPPRGNHMFRFARWWGRGLLWASACELRVEGASLEDTPAVFVANHQSIFDVPALLASVPGQARFMAKRELFRIPLFGWALWIAGFVPVDRRDRSRAAETFNQASQRLRAGASVVVYPEETRSHDGRLRPFKRGGILLALKTGAPIVPVGVAGSFYAKPRHRFTVWPGPITVRYGEAVDPRGAGLRKKGALVEHLEATVAELADVERGGLE